MKKNNCYLLYFVMMSFCMLILSCTHQKESNPPADKNDPYNGKRIVVVTGTSEDVYAQKYLQTSTILQTANTSDLILNVESNKADYGLINYNTVTMFMRKYKNIVIINDSLYGSPVGVGFSKSRTDLRDKFNVFLEKLKKTGEYEQIRKRWIDDFDHAQMPNIHNAGTNGTIKFQTEGEKAPFSFIRDGKLSGLDIEICERFAASLSMKLDVKMSNFAGVIEALSMENVDMAANCIFITPERAKKIAFSDPYFICNACAFGINGSSNNGSADAGFWENLKNSFKQNFIDEGRYKMIGNGLLCTLEITIFSIILGTLLGILICYMRMRESKVWQGIAKTYILLFRGIPQVVLLMLLFYVILSATGLDGITVSIIGFSFIFAAYVSEMFRTAINSVSNGQVEAGLSMGFTTFKTFYYIVLPLTIRRVLPIYKGEIIGLIKSTSIVGYITVQDLTKISDMIRSSTFDAFMPLILITVIYFIIIWIFSLILSGIEIKYSPQKSRFI